MRKALKIMSIIAVVIGALAIIGSLSETGDQVAYSLVGGGLFLAEGILALVYISKQK